ncbi:MAG TPA: hypothetical protein VIQ99_08595, partial [Gammaproteobacteria bacterium]
MMLRTGLGAVAAAAVCTACAGSAFVSSWRAPDASPLQVGGSKVAAVVMMEQVSSRRAAEDALARELTARGAEGVPMYMILPDDDPSDEPAARAALERQGFAGVVVLRPVDTQQEIVATPVYTGPYYSMYWGGYYGYGWGMPWGVGVAGAEIRTNTIVSVETLVYSLRQNMLVWGGQSTTTNPSSVDRLVHDTARKVAKELQQQG